VPAWIAFDDRDRCSSIWCQAESYRCSKMRWALPRHFWRHTIADAAYQAKRAGLLVQLADQGRALARFQTREIVSVLQRRTAGGQLNRGLKVSLPYYDDQSLRLMLRTFDIIPAGRIMYVSAIAVRAVQDEQAKVAQDTRLSSATRDHLLEELEMLRRAFRGDGATETTPEPRPSSLRHPMISGRLAPPHRRRASSSPRDRGKNSTSTARARSA
jgi:hypothetical protein